MPLTNPRKKPGFKKALKQPADLVLAAGGDGTTGKVAFRLIDSGIPLSVLPLGTANNLARALGLVASPEEIIARLEGGKKKVFDVGLATGPWGERYFFEGAGGGLLADYVRAAKKEEKKNGKAEKLSKEQQMARHGALLRRMLHDYPVRHWRIEIDGKDISGRFILWEAMNIRSVGPALHLAPQAATRDGRFDFVCARAADRPRLNEAFRRACSWEEEQVSSADAEDSVNYGLFGRGRRSIWTTNFGMTRTRPRSRSDEIKITVKPSALIILQPAATIKT